MRVSVLVTTYGRRPFLERCIRGLMEQSRTPDEIVIVTREGDTETEAFVTSVLEDRPGTVEVRHARVSEPGVLPANRAGLPLVTGEILCFIDDDAVPHRDWIERIERRFQEFPDLGAVGGRDVQQTRRGTPDDPVTQVGRVHWYGRITGNHHLKLPGLHDVELLKGCNMAFRRSLIRGFDEGIIGNGFFYEADLCFAVRHAGYRVKYDGDLLVDHYIEAPRMLPGNADPRDPRGFFFMHHNSVYVMLKNLPPARRVVFICYTFLWDAIMTLPRLLVGQPAGRPMAVAAIFRGKFSGLAAYSARASGRVGG